MSGLIDIWMELAPFFGGTEIAAFLIVIVVVLIAWFNRAGTPVIIMTAFLLFFGLQDVSKVFETMVYITGAIGAVFLYQAIVKFTGARPG